MPTNRVDARPALPTANVYRNAEDPNDIVIVADASNADKARIWVASDDLKTAMQSAGVRGAPTVYVID